MRGASVYTAVTLTVACMNEPSAPSLSAPSIEATTVEASAYNVLSVIVSARVRNADSVAVRFRLDVPSAGDRVTPAARTFGDSALTAVVPVLGLLPASRSIVRSIAYGAGGTRDGDAIEFTTGPLPSDLPDYSATDCGRILAGHGRPRPSQHDHQFHNA
jgi:hypothetical protein